MAVPAARRSSAACTTRCWISTPRWAAGLSGWWQRVQVAAIRSGGTRSVAWLVWHPRHPGSRPDRAGRPWGPPYSARPSSAWHRSHTCPISATRGAVPVFEQGGPVGPGPQLGELPRGQAVLRHQRPVLVAAGAGCGNVDRIDVAPRVFRGEDGVRVVAIRARRYVGVPGEQQPAMPAGPRLGQLPGGQAVLPHPVGVGVTRGAELGHADLGGATNEPAHVSGPHLERARVSAMAIVATNAALGVRPQLEGAPLVRVADHAPVRRRVLLEGWRGGRGRRGRWGAQPGPE